MKKLFFKPYCDKKGKCEFQEFLDSLPEKDAEKLVAVIYKSEAIFKGRYIFIKLEMNT